MMSSDKEPFRILGSDSQDSDGTLQTEQQIQTASTSLSPASLALKAKGIENAKKRLRAFSIQKKAPFTSVSHTKARSGGSTTVVIGKLSGVKITPKVEDDLKRLPKPPKPGTVKKCLSDSYSELQKRTLADIEDMKRKMELVELGIPLGLICPTSNSDKAMPTKAMPPIKSLLDPAKVDEIIREAKKAKAEGKMFKFDYEKLLPDYDNPFQQKKKIEYDDDKQGDKYRGKEDKEKYDKYDRDKRKSDRYDRYESDRKYYGYKKDDKDRYRDRNRDRTKERDNKSKDRDNKPTVEKDLKETNVNLNDYLVCDSWSLDTEDKTNSCSPKNEPKCETNSTSQDKNTKIKISLSPKESYKESPSTSKGKSNTTILTDQPLNKVEKLQPVMDSFKFEIDPNDDVVTDMFDENFSESKLKQKKPFNTKLFNYSQDFNKDTSLDAINDDNFLESVINEIKQEEISDDASHDKGLVEYDISPDKFDSEESIKDNSQGSVTPEIDDKIRDMQSNQADYSDGFRSTESGYKSSNTSESGYKSGDSHRSSDSYRLSMDKEIETLQGKMSKETVESLETWSFVLKICQPLLFRHDKNKCYKETRNIPKLWYTPNPKICRCVKDRSIVYDELEMCKMALVDRVYGCDQISDPPFAKTRNWYPRKNLCLTENHTVHLASDWEADDSHDMTELEDKQKTLTPQRNEELMLDKEYQRFMDAVWPEISDKQDTSRSTTPVKKEEKKKKNADKIVEEEDERKKGKKIKLSSDGWSDESDLEEELKKKSTKEEKVKVKSKKRRCSSTSISSDLDSVDSLKKRKTLKKKLNKKSKVAKRERIAKKNAKKLKEKAKKKKQKKLHQKSSDSDDHKESKKKFKKKKQQKLKKKNQKRKVKIKSSSSSSSSSSSDDSSSESETDSEFERKEKKKKDKKNKRKQSTSESTQSEDLFDVNILNNIKTERLTDDEKCKITDQEFSPRRQQTQRKEIINVKELQNDLVASINIKQEKEDVSEVTSIKENVCDIFAPPEPAPVPEVNTQAESEHIIDKTDFTPKEAKPIHKYTDSIDQELELAQNELHLISEPKPCLEVSGNSPEIQQANQPKGKTLFKEPPEMIQTIRPVIDELSQCSSQESICSIKDIPAYEKDESHLRPSSQNSNYSFNDVIASQSALYQKGLESNVECDDEYEQENYEMYEQLAMAYQSNVASKQTPLPATDGEQRIETVVRARPRGEIKCDWRAGDHTTSHPAPQRPSRWGLKPGDVNIVLTGGNDQYPIPSVVNTVYKIPSIANRQQDNSTGYDEAYMDMYGAADKLQYGDCFGASDAVDTHTDEAAVQRRCSLDARIDHALRGSVLGEVAREPENTEPEIVAPERGILVNKNVISDANRGSKRVSFADGYKPGQDSDVEEPPVKKRRKTRRLGCAWPCPATHPDHVPLWDALPPPPPPPSPPPAPPPPVAPLLLRHPPLRPLLPPLHSAHEFETNCGLPNLMPPEPPPGILTFQ